MREVLVLVLALVLALVLVQQRMDNVLKKYHNSKLKQKQNLPPQKYFLLRPRETLTMERLHSWPRHSSV